jgi:molybdenum cofactor biosynthesis enzyme MoaA
MSWQRENIKMKINNFQIMVGDERCNARCKYCVSRLTYPISKCEYDYLRLNRVKLLAKKLGITTATITGKGEPTLINPDNLKNIISRLSEEFPIVELQTNGINLTLEKIDEYYLRGLTTLCISRAHYDNDKNKELMGIDQPMLDLKKVKVPICKRLTTTLCKGYIDNHKEVEKLINYAKDIGFEQVTLHPVALPNNTKNKKVKKWIQEHQLTKEQLIDIFGYAIGFGEFIHQFDWGGRMYSIKDLTVVIGFCMDDKKQRQTSNFHSLILGTDGHIRLSWEYKGSVIL